MEHDNDFSTYTLVSDLCIFSLVLFWNVKMTYEGFFTWAARVFITLQINVKILIFEFKYAKKYHCTSRYLNIGENIQISCLDCVQYLFICSIFFAWIEFVNSKYFK